MPVAPTPPPLILLLAAGPDDPGAAAVLTRAAAERGPREVLLSHAGLAWRDDPRLDALRAEPGTRIGVCSLQARDAGWTLEQTPSGVAWSALIAWLRESRKARAIWTVLP